MNQSHYVGLYREVLGICIVEMSVLTQADILYQVFFASFIDRKKQVLGQKCVPYWNVLSMCDNY